MTGHSNKTPTVADQPSRRKGPASDRYAALLDAAQDAFATRGYAGASAEEIAATAGVSKSLVFRHFGNKAGLFGHAVVDPLIAVVDDFASEWDSTDSTAGDLETVITRFVVMLYDRMCAARPMLNALLSIALLPDTQAAGFESVRLRLEALFDRILTQNRKAAERFGIVGVDPPLTIRLTFALTFAITALDGWLLDTLPRRPSRKRVLAELSGFIVAATQSRPTETAVRPGPRGLMTSDAKASAETGRREWGSAPQRILPTAADLFAEKGYAATTTKEVAKHAGVAESLVFFHFPSKDELFTRAIFEPFLEAVDSFTLQAEPEAARHHQPQDITAELVLKLFDWMQADRVLLVAMIHSSILKDQAGPNSSRARTELRRLFKRIEIELTETRGSDAPPLDTPLTVRAMFGTVLALTVLDEWLLAGLDPPATPAAITQELVGYLTAGALRPADPRTTAPPARAASRLHR